MLATGSKLGPYEIVSPLGAGGMGEAPLNQPDDHGCRIPLRLVFAKGACFSCASPSANSNSHPAIQQQMRGLHPLRFVGTNHL